MELKLNLISSKKKKKKWVTEKLPGLALLMIALLTRNYKKKKTFTEICARESTFYACCYLTECLSAGKRKRRKL